MHLCVCPVTWDTFGKGLRIVGLPLGGAVLGLKLLVVLKGGQFSTGGLKIVCVCPIVQGWAVYWANPYPAVPGEVRRRFCDGGHKSLHLVGDG